LLPCRIPAAAWGGRDLAALVRNCARVSVGAATGTNPPDSVGDCALRPPREFGTAAMLFDALRSGAVTAVVALYRRNELDQMQLRAINEIAGVLDTAALVQMMTKVLTGADPRAVAEEWLTANPLGR
jgi:hypothetical protein